METRTGAGGSRNLFGHKILYSWTWGDFDIIKRETGSSYFLDQKPISVFHSGIY